MHSPVNRHKLNSQDIPEILRQIELPPKQLFYSGVEIDDWLKQPRLGVVGSRKMTSYGADTVDKLVSAAARAGVCIISGLAYGVDAKAHQVALDNGALTVAVLPTSLDNIYPAGHRNLAERIKASGGLISEYGPEDPIYKVNFTDRNRLIAGLSDALLIPEAAVNSGSLHTARYALTQGKTVMAVPGNITSASSEGCNNLIKSGAIAVTEPGDIFLALGLNIKRQNKRTFKGTAVEGKVYKQIENGVSDQEAIAAGLSLGGGEMAAVLTSLEINGYIKPLGSGHWTSQI